MNTEKRTKILTNALSELLGIDTDAEKVSALHDVIAECVEKGYSLSAIEREINATDWNA